MRETITLPSGAEVVWKDAQKEIKYGERKRLLQARAKAIKEESDEAMFITGESIIAALVESWTVKDERGQLVALPKTSLKVLEDLSNEDMQVLIDRADNSAPDVFGTRMVKNKENLADKDSPLEESTDSEDSSKE